ncbi:MAG: chorismate synthase [Phycisphaerae bacterium]|nr:chorismate synthase [Phycisphaerae bacterium]
MLGNTFGRVFRITTCGESYGGGMAAIVDGVPPGIKLNVEHVQAELDKRKPGQSKLDSPRLETDKVELFAGVGVRDGITTGAPVGLIIYNVDRQKVHVDQYHDVKDLIRPGHAEYTFFLKYGEYADWCGAGRASGRETVGRVAGGAVAKQILAREGIEVLGHIIESHGIKTRELTFEEVAENYRKNHLNCCDLEVAEKMIQDIIKVREQGDTVGGTIEIIVRGVPGGLGEPVFDKLRATIAHGIMSIGATTAIEFGAGWQGARMLGSEWNDPPYMDDGGQVRFRTNHGGGFAGGISNGEELRFRFCCKPTPTISIAQDSINMKTMTPGTLSAVTRRDITICPRIFPVGEAMTACCILDALYMAKGYEHFAHVDEKFKKIAAPRGKSDPEEIIQRAFRKPAAVAGSELTEKDLREMGSIH